MQLRKPFYAWTAQYSGMPDRIRLQGTPQVPWSETYDRQFVFAGNCEKYIRVDTAFVTNNAGNGRIYFIGDEPDHDGATCLYSPEEYASVFGQAVTTIRSLDPSARFSNGGFAQPNATPAGVPHFTAYADAFIAAYRQQNGGQDPPIAEWRFHVMAVDINTFRAWMDQATSWAAARGQKVFLGSFNGDDMAGMVDYVKANDHVVGASWWSYDSGWPYSLSNPDGTLNSRGQQYWTVTE